MDADGLTFACAMTVEERIARRLGRTRGLSGSARRRACPRGGWSRSGSRERSRDGSPVGHRDRRDARRRRVEGTVLWEGGPLGARRRGPGRSSAPSRIVDDPGRACARCTRATGADAVDMRVGPLARSGRLAAACARSATRRRGRSTGRRRRQGRRRLRLARPGEGVRPLAARLRPRSRRTPAARSARLGDAAEGWSSIGQVLLAAPRSFCAGVDRAIEIVERLLERARAADLRPPPDRPQRPRRPAARAARRGLRRRRGRDPGRRDLRPLGARRRAGGAGELRGARPARRRRRLPARLEGARRGAALRRQRPPRRARRPRRPRRGDRDARRAARGDGRGRVAGGRRPARVRTASRSP